MSALLALDLCLLEIFGAHVEESESRASAPESAGTVDSPDRGDAESAEVGVQIVIHERAVAVDLPSEILAASLAAPANEPERADRFSLRKAGGSPLMVPWAALGLLTPLLIFFLVFFLSQCCIRAAARNPRLAGRC